MKASKFIGRWGAVCGVLLAGLFLAGCKTGAPDPQFADFAQLTTASAQSPAAAAGAPAAAGVPAAASGASAGTNSDNLDMLQVGQSLTITLSDLPELVPSMDRIIKEDGSITLIQNQRFIAAGKTRGDLEKEIRDRYVPKIFKNMTVSIEPKDSTRFYYVGGQVKQPGRQVYLSPIKTLEAIHSAGDFTDFANRKKVKLTRASGKIFIINCKQALIDPSKDLEVFPGDSIYVPKSLF